MLVKNIDLQNKTVLVTGAAGFIGANLVLELFKKADGVKIIGLDNMNGRAAGILFSVLSFCVRARRCTIIFILPELLWELTGRMKH